MGLRTLATLLWLAPAALARERRWYPGGPTRRHHPSDLRLLGREGRGAEQGGEGNKSAIAMVVGGTPVAEQGPAHAFEWMAAVLHYNKTEGFYEQFCGGSLVHPRLVLTAAHCVCHEFGFLATHVAVGRPVLSNTSEGELVPVSAVLVNPNWNMSTADGDIAILLLEHAATAAKPVQILPPTLTESLAAGQVLDALGWGAMELGQVDTPSNTYGMTPGNVHGFGSDILEEAFMDLITNADCDSAYGGGILAEQLCTVTEKGQLASACHGDSGGPLIATLDNSTFLVGIISFGDPNCTAASPNVYTRASSYHGWASSMMQMLDKAVQAKPPKPGAAPATATSTSHLEAEGGLSLTPGEGKRRFRRRDLA